MSAGPRQAQGSRGGAGASRLKPSADLEDFVAPRGLEAPQFSILEPQGLWNAGGCGGSWMAGSRPSRGLRWGGGAGGPRASTLVAGALCMKQHLSLPQPPPQSIWPSLGTGASWPTLFLPLPSPGPGLCHVFLPGP